MGYAHGEQWNDQKVKEKILMSINLLDINRMPTVSELKSINMGALSAAICKHGGYEHWGNVLNLDRKQSETGLGLAYEKYFMSYISNRFGYQSEKMSARFPYDVLIEKSVKADVKCGFLCHGPHGNFYTFNLENKNARCDLYSCFCLDGNKNVVKVYVVPAIVMQDKTQLSIGEINSKYDFYKNGFDLIQKYINFYKEVKSISPL